jgi:glyoxylase-like metal-dependent hydrolase (beta-lactamase superfamily II)
MSLDRRTLLGTAAVALAASPALAKAPLSGKQNAGYYRMKLGAFEVTAVHDGFFARPVEGFVKNAKTEDVAQAVEDARMPAQGIYVPYTTLVVNTGDKLVMFDAGNGDMGPPTAGHWMANFKAAGFDPKDVDVIIFTHFHGDHINGFRLKDGTAVFPNAEVMVPAAEWAHWMDDAKMNAAPEAARGAFQNVRRVFAPIADKVKKFDAGAEVVPGISAKAAYGHTPGHTVFEIKSGDARMMALADTTNVPYLFARNPDWHVIFDTDPVKAAETRKALFDAASADDVPVHLYHAPFPAIGHMDKDGGGFDFKPLAWASSL